MDNFHDESKLRPRKSNLTTEAPVHALLRKCATTVIDEPHKVEEVTVTESYVSFKLIRNAGEVRVTKDKTVQIFDGFGNPLYDSSKIKGVQQNYIDGLVRYAEAKRVDVITFSSAEHQKYQTDMLNILGSL